MAEKHKHYLPLPGLRWRGFTLQMFLLTILPLTALLLAFTFGSQRLHNQAMRSMVGDRDLRAARTAANSLSEEIFHRAALLRLMAGQIDSEERFLALVESDETLAQSFPGGLALYEADGALLRATSGSLFDLGEAEIPRPSSSGQEVSYSQPFIFPSGGQYWIIAHTPAGAGLTLAGAISPVSIAQQALSGSVDPAHTRAVLLAPGQVILYQIGPQVSGDHLAGHPGLANSLAGESGIDYYNSEEGEHVVAFSPVAPVGWGLMLEESWAHIASPLLNTTQAAPLVLVPLLLLALLALWFGARQIVHPLQSLQDSAAELARGNFKAIAEPVGGISEIRLLQDDLVAMARDLEAAQESLRGYISSITTGVESERRALARELHDDTLQTLIALQQRLQLTHLTETDNSSLAEVGQLVQQTITNLRRMVRGLRPIYLEDLGLSASLEMLAKETAVDGTEIVFRCTGTERRLTAETELALYRMTQEALSNINRHAEAAHAWIDLEYAEQHVSLQVRDDGRGFVVPAGPGDFAPQGHFGLLGLHERADLLGAQIAIHSTPGEGTLLRVELKSSSTDK